MSNELKRVLYGSSDTVIQKWRRTSESDLTEAINLFIQDNGLGTKRARYGLERQITFVRLQSLVDKYDDPTLNKALARYLAGRITLKELNRIIKRWKETSTEYARGKAGSPP